MDDVTNDPPGQATGGGPVSERMQTLLSRAVQDQLSEQRSVASALAEVRAQVAQLTQGVQGTASAERLERLGVAVGQLAQELRTATTGLGERVEGLSRRVDQQGEAAAAASGRGTQALDTRLAGLASELAGQAESLAAVSAGLDQLTGFPAALEAVQKDVTGLHERLRPLTDIRAGLVDLAARSGPDILRPDLVGLGDKLTEVASAQELERVRDALLAASAEHAERVQQLLERPVLSAADLATALAALPVSPDLTADLAGLLAGVKELSGRVEALAARPEDPAGATLALALAALREDVEDVGSRLADITPSSPVQVAEAVAPRVADLLMDRLSETLTTQVAAAVSATLVGQLGDQVRAAVADSERRTVQHVDDSVLALAEALLRRRPPRPAVSVPPLSVPAGPPEEVAATSESVPSPARGAREAAVSDAPAGEPDRPEPEPAQPEPDGPEADGPEPDGPEANGPEPDGPEADPAPTVAVGSSAADPRESLPEEPARPGPAVKGLVDSTPDLEADDSVPIGRALPSPAPSRDQTTPAPRAAPDGPQAGPRPPLPPAPAARPSPPVRGPVEEPEPKRRPWWRPGG